MQSWVESKDIATIFYTVETDLWGIGDGSQAMDLLVLATDNGTVTAWGLFPILPY